MCEQETQIQQHITRIGILQEENKSLEQDIEHLKSRVQDMESTVRNQDQQLQVTVYLQYTSGLKFEAPYSFIQSLVIRESIRFAGTYRQSNFSPIFHVKNPSPSSLGFL